MEKRGAFIERNAKKRISLAVLLFLMVLSFLLALMVGSSHLSFVDSVKGLFGLAENSANRIIQNIRLPRALAALLAGAGLALAGLLMQTTLGNPMASPGTLGVSNAAVLGANVAIIGVAGGFLSGHNMNDYTAGVNPFLTSGIAFVFAVVSTLLILGLCHVRSFTPSVVVLAGIAVGAVWTAITNLLQFYATDVGLSAAVVWSFGDLGRATYTTDWIMLGAVAMGAIYSFIFRYQFNALLNGDDVAKSLGVKVELFRMATLLVASLITAVCVSYLGIIGFVGIICPHAMRRLLGNNHHFLIPSSMMAGAILLLLADVIAKVVGNGSAIPAGVVTSLLGAPFFLYLLFARKGEGHD